MFSIFHMVSWNSNTPIVLCSAQYRTLLADQRLLLRHCYLERPLCFPKCSGSCGEGRMSRFVTCRNLEGKVISNSQCNPNTKPLMIYPCGDKNCPAHWVEQEWDQVSLHIISFIRQEHCSQPKVAFFCSRKALSYLFGEAISVLAFLHLFSLMLSACKQIKS